MVVEAEEGRRWYLQVYSSAPGAALMWAQSRASQGEAGLDAHSLQSFPSQVLPNLYFPSKSGNAVEGPAGSGECPQ